jgi:hypothetical protein
MIQQVNNQANIGQHAVFHHIGYLFLHAASILELHFNLFQNYVMKTVFSLGLEENITLPCISLHLPH